MTALMLTPPQRREHRAAAHHLDPVVMIGNDGLTPAVQKEVDAALNAHGLIKIRVLAGEREARDAMALQLCEALGAASVQHIGKLLVLWRPMPAKEKIRDDDRMPGPRNVRVIKPSGKGGQKPEIKQLRVLGNQRLTAGGLIKKARKPQVSSKKRQA